MITFDRFVRFVATLAFGLGFMWLGILALSGKFYIPMQYWREIESLARSIMNRPFTLWSFFQVAVVIAGAALVLRAWVGLNTKNPK